MTDCNDNKLDIGDTISYIERSYTGKATIKTGIITEFKKYFGKECAIVGNGPFAGRAMKQSIRLIKKGKHQ